MPEPLTELERRVYHYLIDFLAENTFQPSVRDIARKLRIKSTKTVADLLQSLAEKGYIEREASRSRGVRLLGFASAGATQPVPWYDRVHATDPALRPDDRQGYVTLERRFLPGDDVVLVKARGNGMSSRGILEGDLVLVSPSTRAADGDLVVTRDGGVTVRAGGDNAAILGVVCGVFRPLFVRETPEPDAPR